jgi:hypothetical protein
LTKTRLVRTFALIPISDVRPLDGAENLVTSLLAAVLVADMVYRMN